MVKIKGYLRDGIGEFSRNATRGGLWTPRRTLYMYPQKLPSCPPVHPFASPKNAYISRSCVCLLGDRGVASLYVQILSRTAVCRFVDRLAIAASHNEGWSVADVKS